MKKLVEYWKKAITWLDSRSDKVRALVLAGLLLVIFLLWFVILYSPVTSAMSGQRVLIKASKQQAKLFQDRADLIIAEAKQSPAKLLKEKHAKLTKDLNELGTSLVVYDAQTLGPGEVVSALRKLLVNNKIKLVHLERTSVEPLSAELADGSKLWQTNFSMEFTGDFFSTLHYLEALEKIKYRIFWEGLEYKVTNYPNATVQLSIYTLNESEDDGNETD